MTDSRTELALELHRAALASLLGRLDAARKKRRQVSAGELAVARRFLADNAALCVPSSPQERRRLARIRALYVAALTAAVGRPNPPASVLQEARLFMEAAAAPASGAGGPSGPSSEAQALPFGSKGHMQ